MQELSLIVLITCIISAGIVGGVIRAWTIISRLSIAEAQILRLQKQFAASERFSRPKTDLDALLLQGAQQAIPPAGEAVDRRSWAKFGGTKKPIEDVG